MLCSTPRSRTIGGNHTERLSASTALQLRLANLFDRQYETAYLYPSLGREAFVTVRYHAP